MSDVRVRALAFLGSGLALTGWIHIALDLGISLVLMATGFQCAAVAVLSLARFHWSAFVVVWAAAVVAVMLLVEPVASGALQAAGGVLFGSCAMLLWLVAAVPLSVFLGAPLPAPPSEDDGVRDRPSQA